MKNFNLFKVTVFSLLAITTSCTEEITEDLSAKTNVSEQTGVKNGRLYFPSKESLVATYKNLKKESPESVQNFIDKKGIESLVPIITQKNENEVISKLKYRKKEYLQKNHLAADTESITISDEDINDDLDDLEEIVGDDVYTAMLNGKAEIQVANKIYKYTDVGLFITTEENYSKLENYLEIRKISSNLLVPTEISIRDNFISDKPNNQLITLPNTNNNINYFISYADRSSKSNTGIDNRSFFTQEPSIASVIQSLPIGEVKKPWIGNIFGETWTTYDRYEKRRRVKVKFYSQNLHLVYAIGCKVKHQYKGWTGTWRKENADQIGIGISSIRWTFKHAPNISTPAGIPKQAYWFGSNMYSTRDGISFTFSKNQNIPPLPFASKLDGIIQFSVNLTGLTEDQLNKLFWENAWKQANKFLQEQNNKKLNKIAFIVDSPTKSYLQYYDFSQVENNQDVIERVFDFGISSPQITYTFGGDTGNGLAVTRYTWDFSNPDAVGVNMYGIAKKNGAWHGVKLNVDKQ